jgi:hypothetical protein
VTPDTLDLPATSPRRADVCIALSLAIFTVILWAPVIRWNLILGDEGWLVSGVQRILAGETLYRDVVRSYSPGVFWSLVPFFRLFGESVVVMRGVALAELAIVAVLTFLIARPLVPRWAALWCGLLPVLLRAPYHKMFVPLSLMVAVWLCQRLVSSNPGSRRTFAVGIGLGLVGLLRQEVAAYATIVALASLLAVEVCPQAGSELRRPILRDLARSWLMLAAGIAVVWVPVVGVLVSQGAPGEVFDQLVLLGLRGNVAMELPFPPIAAIVWGPGRLVASLYYFPIVMVLGSTAAVGIAAARRRLQRRHIVLAQWAAMALLTHSVFMARSGVPHLRQVLPVSALMLAYLTGWLWRAERAKTVRRLLLVPLIGIWAIGLLARGAATGMATYRAVQHGERLDEPGAPVILRSDKAQRFREVLRILRERTVPGEPIFVAPHASMLYVMSGRVNPTRHDSTWPGFVSDPGVQREIITDLEAAGVNILVLVNDSAPQDGDEERRFPLYTPTLAQYLEDHFALFTSVGPVIFYERRSRQ